MKTIFKHAGVAVFFALLYLLPNTSGKAAEHYYSYNKSHQGYSMTESHNAENIVVGGSICQTATDCKIFVQETNKSTGAVIWRKEYNWKNHPERCFKIQKVSAGYLLTGYAYDTPGSHVTFVMEIDPAGNINWVNTYHNISSVGLHLLECSDGSGYVVVGYIMDVPGSSSTSRTGYVMKINPSGNLIWNTLYDSPFSGTDYDMAEQVIEVPGSEVPSANTNLCYYITGSVNLFSGSIMKQKVLSLMLDDNGTMAWSRSFSTGTLPNYDAYTEVGVSSLYEPNLNQIFHVSNAENSHGFYISTIDPANGNVIGHKYIADGTLSSACKLAAYQIHDKDASTVTVVGFIHDYNWSSTTHNPTFAVDIDKASLIPNTIHVFEIPSNGHNIFFQGWLGTPAFPGYPRIHTPDMSIWSGSYIWMVCYKDMPPHYDLAIQRMVYANYTEACDPEDYQPQYGDAGTIDIPISFSSQLVFQNETFTDNVPSYTIDECVPGAASKPTRITDLGKPDVMLVYPSPAQDILHLELNNNSIQTIRVVDISGREVNAPLISNSSIDVSKLSAGIYVLHITTSDNQLLLQRFVKE